MSLRHRYQATAAYSAEPDLPPGWQYSEDAERQEKYLRARRRRRLVLVGGAALIAVVLLIAVGLLLNASSHYARGVAALEAGSYSQADDEFSQAQVLGVPCRDAPVLAAQARRELTRRTAGLDEATSRQEAVTAALGDAAAAFDRRSAPDVLAALKSVSAGDLRAVLLDDAEARAAAAALAEDVSATATRALRDHGVGQGRSLGGRVAGARPIVTAGRRARGRGQGGAEAQRQARRGQGGRAQRPVEQGSESGAGGADGAQGLPRRGGCRRRRSQGAQAQAEAHRDGHPHHYGRNNLRRHLLRRFVPASAAMTLRPAYGTRRAVGALALFVLLACVTAGVGASAASAEAPWATVATPNGTSWAVHDVTCFGSVNLALAGDGRVAVSRDAGHSWKTYVPQRHAGTAFTDVAFATTGRGVLASGGLLLVSDDWGAGWAPPAYAGPGPAYAVNDVAVRGDFAVAVGDYGMIFASSDGGSTWQQESALVAGALTSVAVAADGTAVAGSEDGEILVRTTSWAVAGLAGAPVTSVSAVADPAWGDGLPDLFAATEHDVLGSDDALTFASLPGLPDLSANSWGSVACAGRPGHSVLIAGAAGAGFFAPAGSWVSGVTGLDGIVGAAAPAGQSSGYLLGSDGRLVRTLSAGREPADAALTDGLITVGESSRLTATVRVAAPGKLTLRGRVPGRAWATLRAVPWSTADWDRAASFDLKPSLTHDYALEFIYGGTATRLTSVHQVVVAPKVLTARARYDLRRGSVFRFSGTVAPRLRGERVELYTDRGGNWRPVSLQRTVALADGHAWQSRQFGTPVAETYHLRAHLARTRTHAEAWSRIVTVTIR